MQKTARKNTKYSRNETSLKIGHFAKALAHAKAIAFAKCQFASKIKSAKNMVIKLFCAKKPLDKTPNIREMRQVLKIHLAKAIAHAKAVCKGQKLKMPKTWHEKKIGLKEY